MTMDIRAEQASRHPFDAACPCPRCVDKCATAWRMAFARWAPPEFQPVLAHDREIDDMLRRVDHALDR